MALPLMFEWPVDGELRSFPLPGFPKAQDLAGVVVHPEGLTFPAYGHYNIAGPFGVAKLLLLDPLSDDDERILAICRFVGAAAYHSGADNHLRHDCAEPNLISLTSLLRKLFYSDQPLALWCNEIVEVLAFLLHWRGYKCRRMVLNHADVRHVCLEVHLPTSDRWMIVDVTYDLLLRRDGKYLSGREAGELRAAGKVSEIELVPLTGKGWSGEDLPSTSTGQVAWSAEIHGWHATQDTYYHDTIIGRGFVNPTYATYKFDVFTRSSVELGITVVPCR